MEKQIMHLEDSVPLRCRWLAQFAAEPATPLEPWAVFELAQSIQVRGILEPLQLLINPFKRTLRLDVGNHRVHLMQAMGHTHVPVQVWCTHHLVLSPSNQSHVYSRPDLFCNTLELLQSYTEPYICDIHSLVHYSE